MWMGEPSRPPDAGPPIALLPEPDPGLSEIELVADIWSGDARMAREYALRAQGIARLAVHRRAERDAAFGSRGQAGRDARALRRPALADVSEDFISVLALILCCTEVEAEHLAAEAVLLSTTLT